MFCPLTIANKTGGLAGRTLGAVGEGCATGATGSGFATFLRAGRVRCAVCALALASTNIRRRNGETVLGLLIYAGLNGQIWMSLTGLERKTTYEVARSRTSNQGGKPVGNYSLLYISVTNDIE
jgi:hypothetical protein